MARVDYVSRFLEAVRDEHPSSPPPAERPEIAVIRVLLRASPHPVTYRDLLEATDVGPARLGRVLDELQSGGLVTVNGTNAEAQVAFVDLAGGDAAAS